MKGSEETTYLNHSTRWCAWPPCLQATHQLNQAGKAAPPAPPPPAPLAPVPRCSWHTPQRGSGLRQLGHDEICYGERANKTIFDFTYSQMDLICDIQKVITSDAYLLTPPIYFSLSRSNITTPFCTYIFV